MEYQKAITVLKNLAEKHPLTADQKEALTTAIGVLTLGAQTISNVKARKAKRDSSTKW